MTKDEMNKELIEKLKAIRQDLVALTALVPPDAKIFVEQGKPVPSEDDPRIHELADLAIQKAPTMWRNYGELLHHMTADPVRRVLSAFESASDGYLRAGEVGITLTVAKLAPKMLADLDDIAKKLENNA